MSSPQCRFTCREKFTAVSASCDCSASQHAASAASSSLSKSGVPSPVAASHPGAAAKPYGKASPPRSMALVPCTTSVNASACWYANGLKKPTGGLPALKRASLSSDT